MFDMLNYCEKIIAVCTIVIFCLDIYDISLHCNPS